MELKAIVSKLPHGPIPSGMRDQILELVETCWDKFKGSGQTKMQVWKIRWVLVSVRQWITFKRR